MSRHGLRRTTGDIMAGSTPRPPGYWDAVKDDYFGGVKLRDIYRHHECTKGELDHHRREANWPELFVTMV